MRTYSVVVLDKREREVFNRIIPSLGLVNADETDERTRAVRAIGRSGADITDQILHRALEAVLQFVEVCERESSVDYWTHHLSARPEPISEGMPGDGLVADPYKACVYLAEARQTQLRDGLAALELCQEALGLVSPRPDFTQEN